MFSAWEAGVWKAIHERVRPDIVVGASAGALNGWLIAGGCSPEDLIRDWLDPRTASILKPGLMRAEPLHLKTREMFTRYRPQTRFGLTVVEVPQMRARLICDEDLTWRHLAATCSIPMVLPPVRIGGHMYVDGGLLGALPLWAAEEMGATRAIALNVLTFPPFRTLQRIIRQRRPSAALEVISIEPSAPLGSIIDMVRWSHSKIERWIEMGERDGREALSRL
jgi:predicted acylesterase/phospholipase RssA